MDWIKKTPPVVFRRIAGAAAVGLLILILGIASAAASKDWLLLGMSLILGAGCMGQAALLARNCARNGCEVLEGRCISLEHSVVSKTSRLTVQKSDGECMELSVDRRARFQPGQDYLFIFCSGKMVGYQNLFGKA